MATRGKRRAYGQHFLRDPGIISRIAEAALQECARVGALTLLEIGPGKGAITEELLAALQQRRASPPAPRRLVLCERDLEFGERWRARASEFPWLQVEVQDFLELDLVPLLAMSPIAVVSNLPYSVGTAILVRLARHADQIPAMTLMFQAEVAQRVRAHPGSRSWGSLSVFIQNRFEVEKLLTARPGAFIPPPEVDSEVVVLRRRERPSVDVRGFEDLWDQLLKACFAHRRKMLRSCLPKGSLFRNALAVSGVDDTKRAEALDWADWSRLFQAARELSSLRK